MSGDVFDKCASARLEEYRAADSLGLNPWFREMATEAGPSASVEGHDVVMLGSNNYLGLTNEPRVKLAAIAAVERFGTGCTGSRLMNGTLSLHRELEEALLGWLGGEACLVFTTGYGANLGILSALIGAEDRVFLDSSAHASLYDGALLAQGKFSLFRHNSVESLERRLRAWRRDAVDGGALVAIDGVYSMEGDVAPIERVADVCTTRHARLLVDEAHSLGVIGPNGAGAAADAGVIPDLLVGTFSKSLASCGGFVIGPAAVVDHLRIACRPLLFTASGVPAALAAALEAIHIASREDWRREVVHVRAKQLREGLIDLGYRIGPDHGTAIVPVLVGEDWATVTLWRRLLDLGVFTNAALSPAVPSGGGLLRTSVMATHTEAHIDAALRAFEVARSMSA
jgi:8-amino-7-oxononanoate synthase